MHRVVTARASRRAAACASLLAALGACLASGCGPKDAVVPNRAPHVALSAGPVDSTTDSYAIPLQWRAWDEDGAIDHFLYAIDDTGSDTAWTLTREHTQTLVFSATTQRDSTTFTDWHTFYIKAVDNEGAESPPASVTFNALTVAPRTIPLKPVTFADALGGINAPLFGGSCLRLEWTGDDPDGVAHNTPVAYLVVRALAPGNIAGNWEQARDVLTGPGAEVTRVDGSVTSYVFCNLTPQDANANWLFWVRAVDEAGAVEPWPHSIGHWPGYFFFYFAQHNLQGPILTTSSKALGRYVTQGFGRDSVEYVYDSAIAFQWEADASNYGADIDGYRWGVDVTDLEDPFDPGWATGWNRSLTSFSGLVFHDRLSQVHDVVIQARDSNGAITTHIFRLTLIIFEFDRDVLFVDDELEQYAIGAKPTNSDHQSFMQTSLGGALATLGRPPRVDTYTAFPDTNSYLVNRPPRLSDFSHYRVLVWDTGPAPLLNTLWGLAAVSKTLTTSKANPAAIFLESGGSLIISGFMNARSTIRDIPTSGSSIGPSEGLDPELNNFAINYWHIPDLVWFARSDAKRHGQLSADPTTFARTSGYLGGYPQLVFDKARWYKIAATGSVGAEALDNRPAQIDEGMDALEPLYTYGSTIGYAGTQGSFMHGLVCAQLFKKAPTTPNEDWHYQVAFMGSPWYLYEQPAVQVALTNLLASCLGDRKWQIALPPPRLATGGRPDAE